MLRHSKTYCILCLRCVRIAKQSPHNKYINLNWTQLIQIECVDTSKLCCLHLKIVDAMTPNKISQNKINTINLNQTLGQPRTYVYIFCSVSNTNVITARKKMKSQLNIKLCLFIKLECFVNYGFHLLTFSHSRFHRTVLN